MTSGFHGYSRLRLSKLFSHEIHAVLVILFKADFCRAFLLLNLTAAGALPLAPPGSRLPPEPSSRPPHLAHRDIVGTPHNRIKDFLGVVLLAGAFSVAAVGLATAPMLLYNLKATREQKTWSEVVDSRNYAAESFYTAGDQVRY